MIRAVVFDVGETLVDETRVFAGWADWLGVPRHTFSAVVGAAVARGESLLSAMRVFREDFDWQVEDARRKAAGESCGFGSADLYPDVRPCIAELKRAGLWVGIAGNQPVRAHGDLVACELPVDLIATSEGWAVSKPDPAFFRRVVDAAPCEAAEILYVGDRVDNDVIAAKQAGLRAGLLRRGPWGFIEQGPDGGADVRLDGLRELPGWVAARR
ncbi:HAD family hydrolase [Streptantibioticus rubrisoli]|uniref:HAD family hydrolase n=1 Tax=Streptantibioticus rubrisoli TaxID=1387313 RepID=A0ABT1PFB4_9ACTN|nr:HAD family hydrolase [Streptantibioticus rubrisoli]MCQ4044067.1 HAD family hydrolase [Streptantibioticus rubrisoli]